MLSRMWWKWLALTILHVIVFELLDAIFDKDISISFAEMGLLAFVILWCESQDEAKRRKEPRHDNQ